MNNNNNLTDNKRERLLPASPMPHTPHQLNNPTLFPNPTFYTHNSFQEQATMLLELMDGLWILAGVLRSVIGGFLYPALRLRGECVKLR